MHFFARFPHISFLAEEKIVDFQRKSMRKNYKNTKILMSKSMGKYEGKKMKPWSLFGFLIQFFMRVMSQVLGAVSHFVGRKT